jgi:tetratricopeptide (TPR) repeat protein
VPTLLDRGDPAGREFAVQVAIAADTPEMHAALRDFAVSQRGPDDIRVRAAQKASDVGLFPPGPVRLWIQGEWRDIMLANYVVHSEPESQHSPRVEELLREATLALRAGQTERAEGMLNEALALEPDAPDVLNNLAVAYHQQGRDDEALALLHQIVERHPEYPFARASLARTHVLQGELDRAQELLEPLMARKRFHIDEFGTFAAAQISLLLARGDPESARIWLGMWEQVDPEHPEISVWRQKLGSPSGPAPPFKWRR